MGINLKLGGLQKENYDITVVVLTYEQSKEKIILTLASILDQKDINMQIIISDDGSVTNYLQESVCYMEEKGFQDYKVLYHESNQGTVKNYYDALSVTDGEYVKLLCPGDCFSGTQVLRLWLKNIKKKKSEISFCDSIYYLENDGKYECVREVAHPQRPEIYRKRKSLRRKYYLLYNDTFLGASVLANKRLVQKYLQILMDKIKYAEDNIYRLMLLDGVSCEYFPEHAIFYEWGEGISTKANSEYGKALKTDWEITSRYICNHCKNDLTQRKIKYCYNGERNIYSLKERVFSYLISWDMFIYKTRNKTKKMTDESDLAYLYKLKNDVNDDRKRELL